MLASDNNSHSFGFGTLGLLVCVQNNLYSGKALNCITCAVSFTQIFPNYITQFDTQCSVYSLQNYLQGVRHFCFFLQSAMLVPLHLIFSRLTSASSPGFCDTPLAFIFILYSFFSAHNPTESWLSFLCRLWPWCICFPYQRLQNPWGSKRQSGEKPPVGKATSAVQQRALVCVPSELSTSIFSVLPTHAGSHAVL